MPYFPALSKSIALSHIAAREAGKEGLTSKVKAGLFS